MDDKNPNLSTLASNIKQGVDSRLKDLHTAQPGIVESFNPETQTASIQPAIKRIFKTNDGEMELLTPTELPILINVPVQFPRGGGFSLTFPVAKGDECLLVFCERSIDNWHEFGGVQTPTSRRFHHLSDATAFVGLSSLPNKVPSYNSSDVELRNDEGDQRVILKANKDIELDTPSGNITVNCKDVTANVSGNMLADVTGTTTVNSASVTVDSATSTFTGAVTVQGLLTYSGGLAGSGGSGSSITGNLDISSGDVTADGISLKTHTHSQANDSAGNTESDTGVAQ